MFKSRQRAVVDLELVFVHDENGWVRIPDEDEHHIWENSQLYTWTNFGHDGAIVIHFFEFTG